MILRALLVPLLASTALACAHQGSSHDTAAAQPRPAATAAPPRTAPAPAPTATAAERMRAMCPMDLPGTQLSAADTATGEALTFTTTPDQTTALRERVRAMAEMHGQHHAVGETAHTAEGHGDTMGEHGMHGGMAMPPPSRAVVEDVENGARVVVTPNDPADLQKLQSTVKSHAEHMQQEGCGMMGGGPPQR